LRFLSPVKNEGLLRRWLQFLLADLEGKLSCVIGIMRWSSDGNLAFNLPRQYNEDVDLVVAVFCPDYASKEWCRLEWKAIYGLIMQNASKQVMLPRFAGVKQEGVYGLGGFIELDDMTAGRFAGLILQRLALNEDKPRDFYLVNLQQPTTGGGFGQGSRSPIQPRSGSRAAFGPGGGGGAGVVVLVSPAALPCGGGAGGGALVGGGGGAGKRTWRLD
jgi:hypothetical protein